MAPSLSLPMIRSATLAYCVYRIDHLLSADNDIVEQAFSCASPGSTRAGSACLRTPNSDKPASVGTMCFPWQSGNAVSSARR